MLSQHANTEILIHHMNKYHEYKLIEFMWVLVVIRTPNSLLEKIMSAVIISPRELGVLLIPQVTPFPKKHISLHSISAYLALAIAFCDCAAILSL